MNSGKFLRILIVLILFVSCNAKPKKDSDSSNSIKNELTSEESDYLKKRDEYIEQLQRIQKLKSSTDDFDSLYKAERRAMLELEGKLKIILKTSRFSDKGEINLETLLGYLGFGMLDGLSFDQDSITRVFYTTKNLYFNYFKTNEGDNPFDKLSADVFATIFNSAFQSDVHVENYFFSKLSSSPGLEAYGMIAGLSQMSGPFPPQHVYVLVSMNNLVYMTQISLKEPIKEISKCKSVWDSVHQVSEKNLKVYRSSNLKDTTSFNKGIELEDLAYKKYCGCYNQELKNDGQLAPILRQMELIATYIEHP